MMAQIVCTSVEFTQAAYSISRPTPFSKKIVTHCISQMHDDRRMTPFRCRPKIWITRIRFHIENSVHVNFAYNKTFRPTSNSRFSNFSLYACVLTQYTQARCGVWRLCGLWHRWRHRRRRWPVPLRRSVPLAASAAACGKQAQKKNGGKTFAAFCGGLWPVAAFISFRLWPVAAVAASAAACGLCLCGVPFYVVAFVACGLCFGVSLRRWPVVAFRHLFILYPVPYSKRPKFQLLQD